MLGLDHQLHGYRQGHQLLSGTTKLPKGDQDLVDRLSDVAGPLTPGERFSPYLTCYPLPSKSHYVVARTWQDFKAPRAGCVRTRSVLVPMDDWQDLEDVTSIVSTATQLGPSGAREQIEVIVSPQPLPTVDILQVTELCEAMFLEERVPIVVFDSERPEVIALRLITALWPAFRRTFSASTFCRSPRTIGRRSFDLVFAPKSARSRFADWKGRRIDGRRRQSARHRWSSVIVERVFDAPHPSLRELDVLGEMSSSRAGDEAPLRVSLLWEELQAKAGNTPNAVLGLLDIANTRSTRNLSAIRKLDPLLARAAGEAIRTLPPDEAWRFLGALTQKLTDIHLSQFSAHAIRSAAKDLAIQHPMAAIERIPSFSGENQRDLLTRSAADGLARVIDQEIADRLTDMDSSDLLDLLLASPTLAKKTISSFPAASTSLGHALATADAEVRHQARRDLMHLLVDDDHVEPARILMADVDLAELIAEAAHLEHATGLRSEGMRQALVDRARALQSESMLRDAVASLGSGEGIDATIEMMLHPTAEDVDWLIRTGSLGDNRRVKMLLGLLRAASNIQIREMLPSGSKTMSLIRKIEKIEPGAVDALSRIALNVSIPESEFVALSLRLLPNVRGSPLVELAGRTLEIALPLDPRRIGSDSLAQLLRVIGRHLNADKVFRMGLQRGVPASAVNRNLIVFNGAEPVVRKSLMMAVEQMAESLVSRHSLDLTIEGAEAAASLLWDSHTLNYRGFLRASATILPLLLGTPRVSASPLIAAAFPPVYKELELESAADFLNFIFMFVDWDKGKSARRRLVDSFMRSDWRPTDIALAAARAGDPIRILGRIARERGGAKILKTISNDLKLIPGAWRRRVQSALKQLTRHN